jgi:hypothetical protein
VNRAAARFLGADAVGGGQHAVDERAHRLDPDVHVGDLGLDHLEFGDRATELLARLGMLDGQLQGAFGYP